jgi:hypothetical protein
MAQRDRIALIVGIILAIGWCALLTQAGFGAGALLVIALLLSPLISSLIAGKRLFLSGFVPNILIASFFSIVGALSPYNRAADGGLSEESWIIIPMVFGVSVVCALLVVGPVWLVRKAIMRGEHQPKPDAEQIVGPERG